MRVLWIGNPGLYVPSHKRGGSGYNGGGWVSSVQKEIVKQSNVSLGVSFCMDGEPERVEQDGVVYYPVPNHRKAFKDKIKDLLNFRDVTRDEVLWPYYIDRFKCIIEDFKPDVIEVFGSELYAGLGALAAKELNVPCALHLQGLLSLSLYIYLPPGVSRCSYIFSRGLRGAYGNFQLLTYWHRSCHREKTILKAVPHVLGRTDWDRHAMAVLNPKALYHYGGEILRDIFYEAKTRTVPKRPVIMTTISFPTYKGFDVVLKVANILKNEMHLDFEWKVFGNVNPHLFEAQIGLRHEDLNIRLCGVATAEQLRDVLLSSTMYFHPSYVENSSNSVGEAQLVGVPVVASRVGGTDSMVENGKTGFLYPVTDPYIAAYYIERLVTDANENVNIGKAAREVALVRHERQTIVAELLKTYESIIEKD